MSGRGENSLPLKKEMLSIILWVLFILFLLWVFFMLLDYMTGWHIVETVLDVLIICLFFWDD
jgi:hypothetical protein